MTVEELISQLERYKENTTVYCYDPEKASPELLEGVWRE
jgi:hypothetical protein